nr:serine/threonine protein phosphatase 2A regulatory subunit B''beta-like [Tanacetum cinerariifolium]
MGYDLMYLPTQLNEVPPLALKLNLYVAEKLFDQWLSLPETTLLVEHFCYNSGSSLLEVLPKVVKNRMLKLPTG